MIRLVIFDGDGTLVAPYSGELLPGVAGDLAVMRRAVRDCPAYAIATNQGGVGCRVGFGGFGRPERYPTEAEAISRYRTVADRIGAALYMSFAYQSSNGGWSMPPADTRYPEYWQPFWRKPSPGMLLAAMSNARVLPAETLMVGDRSEDQEAAAAAGCTFQLAHEFWDTTCRAALYLGDWSRALARAFEQGL